MFLLKKKPEKTDKQTPKQTKQMNKTLNDLKSQWVYSEEDSGGWF